MNKTIEDLLSRRSCKDFVKGKRASDEMIDLIAKAGTFAPTGKGMQSPKIVVVNDDATVKKLSKLNAEILGVDIDPFYNAPTVLIVFADSTFFTYLEDGALVMGNMLNAAHSLGLGGCWIHRARQMFETQEGKDLMKKWGLNENLVGIGNCVIGYKNSEPKPSKPRKDDYVLKV